MSDKTVVSISEMARMVGLSRQRLHQLIVAGVFPAPLYDIATRRPFYNEEIQQVCLEVRRRHCGVNGKPILFYARRVDHRPRQADGRRVVLSSGRQPKRQNDKATVRQHADLIEGLKGLGMSAVTASQVDGAIKEALPKGVEGMAPAEVLRAVFLHLQRKEYGR
jgi:predicted DNA-binding transcriptional regulator AlpA